MRLEKLGFDLTSFREITPDEDGNRLLHRIEYRGVCHDVFKAEGVALPPTIRRG